MSCKHFPVTMGGEQNPAIWLFGNRLVNDQSPTEFLVEFLLVCNSPKRIGRSGTRFSSPLPAVCALEEWSRTDAQAEELRYAPRARLNLKLLAFMGASRLDSCHRTHREHYRELVEQLKTSIRVADTGSESDVLHTLENLFLGFHGAGRGRTWCAQSFFPVSRSLLAIETIWGESAARRNGPKSWSEVMDDLPHYFASDKRLFIARGGELIYLQLCNALRQKSARVKDWIIRSGVCIEPSEQDPEWLHGELQHALEELLDQCPHALNEIAEFLDTGVDSDTAEKTDTAGGQPRDVKAGSCAEESWEEGYLFAVELLRLCRADLDIIERLRLLEAACAMQVLRTLAAQSVRHSLGERKIGWPGYRLAVSAPDGHSSAAKRISQRTAKVAERLIYHGIRAPDVPQSGDSLKRDRILKEADRRYGGKLFNGMAKRIGLMVPRRGAGARFTINEQLLRFLVVTTVPVGGRLTYDRFKQLVEARHGLVFDSDGFARASEWADGIGRVSLGYEIDAWLHEMLEAAGLLIHLSDSCALVLNPAAKKGAES